MQPPFWFDLHRHPLALVAKLLQFSSLSECSSFCSAHGVQVQLTEASTVSTAMVSIGKNAFSDCDSSSWMTYLREHRASSTSFVHSNFHSPSSSQLEVPIAIPPAVATSTTSGTPSKPKRPYCKLLTFGLECKKGAECPFSHDEADNIDKKNDKPAKPENKHASGTAKQPHSNNIETGLSIPAFTKACAAVGVQSFFS